MNLIYRLLGLLLLITLFSCVQETNFPINKIIVCDAEQITEKGDKFIASNDSSEFFNGGSSRSNLAAYSGNYSALTIPSTKAFAFGHKIKDTGPDAYFKISVWRKSKDGKGTLVIAGNNTDVFYLANSESVEMGDNGWEKLEIEAYTPPHFENGILTVYVWNNGSDTVYYDDLIIERKSHKQYPAYDYFKGLDLVLDTSEYLKIMKKRRKAFENAILQTSDNDWVKGIVVDYDKAMKAKMRLKGDWLDHLWGDKWSYRVKMRKNNTFNRLRTFSLQTPKARGLLLEWLTHQLYHKNDVLTTRYGFIPLMLNEQPRGIYAWEEHFVKQLPEWNKRREGPIVKFSEDPFWQIQKISKKQKKWLTFPFYQTAVIIPFGQSRTVKNPVLYNQFLVAQKLMYQYKTQQKTPSEIFDVNKLAKYYAMLELTHARHGMTWHNQRMYYNPVICKLEPIAFDGYTEHLELDLTINDNVAYRAITQKEPVLLYDYLIYDLFTDSIFIDKYLYYLESYSKPDFINSFLGTMEQEASHYDSLLKLEFPNYHYDNKLLAKSAEAIRKYLPELKIIISDNLSYDEFTFNLQHDVYNKPKIFENTPEFFVNSYTEQKSGDSLIVSIHNYYPDKLVFIGTGIGKKLITDYFIDEANILAYESGMNGQLLTLTVDTSANHLFFLADGNMDAYSIPILPWPYPDGITPQQELWDKVDMNNEFFEKISGNNIYVRNGSFTIDEPIIIPDGYNVHFSAGTNINLINNALIISYSPVFMIGTKLNPVVITSSDYTGNGFTVLQAEGKSELNNVIFEKLNTLDYNSWALTGAVSFYESDVSIKNTKFYRNQCEDALNIIRSEFSLSNSSFDYIYGDAFDGDFCIGEVTNTSFTNIGNDAMDFSGSDILIKNSKVIDAKDKGISGGEESKVVVMTTVIQNSNIGIASKDLSIVEVIDSKIENCNYGLVLLQKKPEFGPSEIQLKNTPLLNSKVEMLVEKNSKVIMNNTVIMGTKKNIGDIFY